MQRIAIIQFISAWKSGCEDHKFIQVSLQKDTTDYDLTIWVPLGLGIRVFKPLRTWVSTDVRFEPRKVSDFESPKFPGLGFTTSSGLEFGNVKLSPLWSVHVDERPADNETLQNAKSAFQVSQKRDLPHFPPPLVKMKVWVLFFSPGEMFISTFWKSYRFRIWEIFDKDFLSRFATNGN